MTPIWRCWFWKLGLASLLGMGGAIASLENCALAQSTPDTTPGAESSVVTPTNIDGLPTEQIDGGATRGANLFHSFEQFSVPTGSAAYFNNALDIQNIISRVTGSSISNIDGLLRANGTANLFLLNPNGIIFGPNASLNIGGSFLASTANSLNFADGTQFSATAPQTTPLLTVSVPMGLQYGGTAGAIRNQSQVTNSSGEIVGLHVLQGKTLALIGGDVSLEGGALRAPGGRVELGGVAEAGTVGLNFDGDNLGLSLPIGVQRADVSLTNGAQVNVLAGGGGSIALNARNLDILEGSKLRAGIESGLGSVDAQAGDITLNAMEAITVADSSIFNDVLDGAAGNGGEINIKAGSLSVTDGTQLAASTFGQGNAGVVTILARDTVSLDGSSVFSTVEKEGVGNSGGINITTGSLSLTNGAVLNANTYGQGDAGSMNINARNTVSFDGVDSNGSVSGAASNVEKAAVGNSGDINLTTGSLTLTNGAQLQASTEGQGDAGSVNILARNTVTFDGVSSDGANSGALSRVEEGAVGNGGDINIMTESISVTNGAQMSASTSGQGDAGSVTIQARNTVSFDRASALSTVEAAAVGNGGNIDIKAGSLSLTDGAQLLTIVRRASDTVASGSGNAGNVNIDVRDTVTIAGMYTGTIGTFFSLIASAVDTEAMGKAGDIKITARALSITDNAQIRSTLDKGALGEAGDINVQVQSLLMANGALLAAFTAGQGDSGSVFVQASDSVSLVGSNTAVASSVERGAAGNGGEINIKAGSLSLTNGAQLVTAIRRASDGLSSGQGNAGRVNIDVRNAVTFDGVDDGLSSGAFSTVEAGAVGNGGGLNITTGSLSVTNGAQLSASSEGNGAAGNIEVEARSIHLNNQAFLSSDTTTGQGNIFLRSGDLVLRHGSNITTNATGTATGGNINIGTDVLAALENSDIRANAQEGFGGRVIIDAQGIFGTKFRSQQTPESDITASSNLGPEFSGTVEINTPDVDPSSGLVTLPAEVVDASALIASSRCGAGGRQEQNKFIVSGRGGLPIRPGDAHISHYPTGSVRSIPSSSPSMKTPRSSDSSSKPDTNPTKVSAPTQIVEAQGWAFNDKGEVVLTATAPTDTLHIPWLPPASCQGS